MRIITGCMRPTETTFLPVLAGISPPDIRREACVARITAKAKNNSDDHLLHHKVTAVAAACPQRLVSRRPFSRHAARLCNDNYDPAKAWSDRVDSCPPLIRTACPSLDMCYLLSRSPPQTVGETESHALWHRACWRHVKTLGCPRVGHVCLRTHHTVSAACGRGLHATQGP